MTPSIRRLGDLRPVLSHPEAVDDPERPAYFMYRGVHLPGDEGRFSRAGVRFDVTVMPPASVGGEYVKTFGHYHSPSPEGPPYPELYQVVSGRAVMVLQRPGRSPSELEDLVLVEAREGQSVLIPPGYGHVTVNPSGETLVMVNLVSSSCVSDYRPFAALRGAAVYLEEGGLVPNPRYGRVPEPRLLSASEWGGSELREAYGEFVSESERFLYLVRPSLLSTRPP